MARRSPMQPKLNNVAGGRVTGCRRSTAFQYLDGHIYWSECQFKIHTYNNNTYASTYIIRTPIPIVIIIEKKTRAGVFDNLVKTDWVPSRYLK